MTTPPQNAAAYEVAPPNAVEPKTLAATGGSVAGTIVSGFALYLIGVLIYHDGGVPLPVSLFVGLVVTTGLTFVGGFYARHVNRSAPLAAAAPSGGADLAPLRQIIEGGLASLDPAGTVAPPAPAPESYPQPDDPAQPLAPPADVLV